MFLATSSLGSSSKGGHQHYLVANIIVDVKAIVSIDTFTFGQREMNEMFVTPKYRRKCASASDCFHPLLRFGFKMHDFLAIRVPRPSTSIDPPSLIMGIVVIGMPMLLATHLGTSLDNL
eukprot:CCRYP_019133-RA/>CCRYP_019133-RA protein AED:0.26 eAED:0.45 QI:464/0/0.5/1/0/0/2/0/118